MSQTGMEDNLYTADQFIEIFGSVIADALKKLDQLTPAKKTQKWIPVSERLPDKNGEYLVTVRKDSRFAFNGEATVYEDTFYSLCQWDDCGEDVIAWMEMPEPYKEEEQ